MAADITTPPDTLDPQAAAAAQQQQTVPMTAQQRADASAAWLAQNRPDLVSRPSATAEEAAAINLAYRTDQLPVLPKYAPRPADAPGGEMDLTRVYIGGSAEVQGTPMDLTRSQYISMFGRTPEESEAAKYFEFNRPIDYGAMANVPLSLIASRYGEQTASRVQDYYQAHPSAAYLAITSQYEARQQYSVGSGGVQYQPTGATVRNPFPEDSAAGIAWISARQSGGQVTAPMMQKAEMESMMLYGVPFTATIPQQYSEGRLTGGKTLAGVAVVSGQETVPIRDLSYEATQYGGGGNVGAYYQGLAWTAVATRPGYTPPAQLGDTTTRQVIAGYTAFSQVMGMTGVSLASPTTMTGQVLEMQRQLAYATPSRRDETYYMNELQKWGQNYVEVASAYHHVGMKADVPIPANPFEYQADLAVEFLKGAPQKESEIFSPVSGEMGKHLPGGEGIQQFAWREAVSTYRRSEGMTYTTPKQVSFMEGVRYLGAAEGLYGPYGKLWGGVDTGGVVTFGGGRLVGSGIVAVTAAEPEAPQVSTVMRPSEFSLWAMQANVPILSGAAVATSDFLFSGTGPIAAMAKSGADVFRSVGVGPGGEATFTRYMVTTETGAAIQGTTTSSMSTPVTEYTINQDGSVTATTTATVTESGSVITPVTIKQIPIMGGFEYGSQQLSREIISRTPEIPQEFGKGTPWEYNIEFARGAYEGLREKPLEAAAWAGIGGVMVAGGMAASSLGVATIAATEGTALAPIAVGTHWFVSTAAPTMLTGLYATDVAQRSTQARVFYGTPGEPLGLKLDVDLSPKSTYRFGEIFATETGPMVLGGAAVAYGPGAIRGGISRVGEAWRTTEIPRPVDVYRGIKSTVEGRVAEYRLGRGETIRISPEEAARVPYVDVSIASETAYTAGGKVVGGTVVFEEPARITTGGQTPQSISIEDYFGPIPEGYTRITHVTTATEEILAGVSQRGLMVGKDTVSLAQTSVDIAGNAPWPYDRMSAPSAGTDTWYLAMRETYLEGKAGRDMFGNYERFGSDILVFDVPIEMYGKIAGSEAFYTGSGTFKGSVTREQLARGFMDVPEPKISASGLTEAEYTNIITKYTGPEFEEISTSMRAGKGLEIGGRKVDVGAMFEQYGTTAPGEVYRGLTGRTAVNAAGMKAGDVYTDMGLQSFSSAKTQAYLFTEIRSGKNLPESISGSREPVMLRYRAETGEKIIDVSKLGLFEEAEIIVSPGEFKVTGVRTEYVGAEGYGSTYSSLIGKVKVIDIERIPSLKTVQRTPAMRSDIGLDYTIVTDEARYAALENLFAEPGVPLLGPSQALMVPQAPWTFAGTRVSGARVSPAAGKMTLWKEEVGIPTFGGARTKEYAGITYDIEKLSEPPEGSPIAWTTSQRTSIAKATTTRVTLDPYTGTFTAFVSEEFKLSPAQKAAEVGPEYRGGSYAYQMNIFDLPMYTETPGAGKIPIPDTAAITKTIFREQRMEGLAGVEATRTTGTYGILSKSVVREGVVEPVDVIHTREINKAFETLMEAKKPVEVEFGQFAKGTPKPSVVKAAKARTAAEAATRAAENAMGSVPTDVIDIAFKGTGAKREGFGPVPGAKGAGGTILEGPRPTVSMEEHLGNVARDIMRDITPAGTPKTSTQRIVTVGGKKYTFKGTEVTPESTAKAMKAAQKAHEKTLAKNAAADTSMVDKVTAAIQRVNPVRTVSVGGEKFTYIGRGITESSKARVMTAAQVASEKTIAFNKEFVGGQIADILEGKTTTVRRMEPIVDTTEYVRFSDAMLKVYQKQGTERRMAMVGFEPTGEERALSGLMEDLTGAATGEKEIPRLIDIPRPDQRIGIQNMEDINRDINRRMDKFGTDIFVSGKEKEIVDTERWERVIPIKDVTQITRTLQDQIVDQFEITKPWEDTEKWKRKFPDEPRIPPIGIGFGGGAGGGPSWMWGTGKHTYRNPVVDIEYLIALSGSYSKKKGGGILEEFHR